MPASDIDTLAGAPAATACQLRIISQEECELFSACFMDAPVQPNGLFQLSHMPVPEGHGKRWAYRMCEERDCASIAERMPDALDAIEGIVVDRSLYDLRDRHGEATASYRVVSVHAQMSNGSFRLFVVRRREERRAVEATSMAGCTLTDYRQAVQSRGLDLGVKPLLSLEPELAHPDERRLLVAEGVPYAILLEPDHPVVRVLGRPNDVFDGIAVQYAFDHYKPRRDRSRASYLPIGDLRERKEGPTRRVHEYVMEVLVNGTPTHFVVWPAPRPETERLKVSLALAMRAAELIVDPPGAKLRINQFHHPHDVNYYNILQIVDVGQGV